MKRLKAALILFLIVVFLIGLIFFLIGFLKPKVAGIFVDAEPQATVYIDGQNVGKTPFRDTRKPGEVVIRLIPSSFQVSLFPYDTKVDLKEGLETVVRRQFGQGDQDSSGEIISFEKISKNETSLAVVTVPDSVQLTLDGLEKSFTPQKSSGIAPGKHSLLLTAAGYQEKILDVSVFQGYKLTAVVQLAKSVQEARLEPTPTPQLITELREEIEIIPTQTGFLRVRSEPSTLGQEVGRVAPGGRYKLVEVDPKTGWFKIEYDEGKTGWVSNQFAKKVATESLKQTEAATPSGVLPPP